MTVSRTSRLFLLLDSLRGHRRPVAAARLAETLSVSLRTIYRDIGTLVELGAPIDGEAGIGYVLRTGFFLPPLMFTEDELDAPVELVLVDLAKREQWQPAFLALNPSGRVPGVGLSASRLGNPGKIQPSLRHEPGS